MRIGVISKSEKFWSTKMIIKAIRKKGHEPVYLKTQKIRLVVGDEVDATYQGRSLKDVDVVIPRIGRSMTDFGLMLLRQLEMMQIPSVLSHEALLTARNKYLALQALEEAKVPIPKTILLASRIDADEALRFVPYPAILKLLKGTQGMGVMKVKDVSEASSIIDTINVLGEIICLQEFIPNPGVDIRAFVVGDKIVAGMKRVAPLHEWRSNIHLGAKGMPYELSGSCEETALKATRATKLEIAGVDMIMWQDKPYVLEVNACPGFRGLLAATGVNAGESIADYAVRKGQESNRG